MPEGRQPIRAGAELFDVDGKPAGVVTRSDVIAFLGNG